LTLPILFVALWSLLFVSLFGLARLLIARRGLDDDWQDLVAYGRSFPIALGNTPIPPGLIESAPPGLADAPGSGGGPPAATLGALWDRVRAQQAVLQAEMKWHVRRGTSPFQWFRAGVRGLLLLPQGLAFDGNAALRARRRAAESHPDFQRVVNALFGVILFVLLGIGWLVARDEGPALASLLAR
jgi:hypothetical protein